MGFDLMSNFTQFIGGGSVKLWSSGATVLQWDYRRSPLDGEVYQRKTATGSGTTDPADDATNYNAVSFIRSGAIPESAPVTCDANSDAIRGTTAVLLPATINAGARTKILDVSGRGRCSFLAFLLNTTATNCRIEVICDGRTLYDYTQAVGASATPFFAQVPIGALTQQGTSSQRFTALPDGSPVYFRRTLAVWVTPSASATNNRLWHQVRGET